VSECTYWQQLTVDSESEGVAFHTDSTYIWLLIWRLDGPPFAPPLIHVTADITTFWNAHCKTVPVLNHADVWGSGGIAPHCNCISVWKWLVKFILQLPYHRGRRPVRLGGTRANVGIVVKREILPCWKWTLASSPYIAWSIYWLSCPYSWL
jgi:hypothetical protein